jgi:hypothetical protein
VPQTLAARHGSIWEALPAVEFLLNGLEVKSMKLSCPRRRSLKISKKTKGAAQGPANECATIDITHISARINNCWEKLHNYHGLVDPSSGYAATVALDSKHK